MKDKITFEQAQIMADITGLAEDMPEMAWRDIHNCILELAARATNGSKLASMIWDKLED